MGRARRKSDDLVGLYRRVPVHLKAQMNNLSQKKSCSQAQVFVELVTQALEGPAPAKSNVSDWLSRQ